jgi:hypothetical protein
MRPEWVNKWLSSMPDMMMMMMNALYEKLNRKLDLLTKQTGNTKTHKGNTQTENNGLINLTYIPFTKEQIKTLKMSP